MKDDIAALLKEYAQHDDVLQKQLIEGGSGITVDKAISNLAARLAERIGALKRTDDVTFKKLSNDIREANLREVNDTLRSAETLLQGRYCNESLRAKLNELCCEMAGLRAVMPTPLATPDKMPKATRLYLCADIIIAWKFIRGVDKMPGRINDAHASDGYTPTGKFHGFLTKLLPETNQDELHRNILAVEKELNQLRAEADKPAAIQLLD